MKTVVALISQDNIEGVKNFIFKLNSELHKTKTSTTEESSVVIFDNYSTEYNTLKELYKIQSKDSLPDNFFGIETITEDLNTGEFSTTEVYGAKTYISIRKYPFSIFLNKILKWFSYSDYDSIIILKDFFSIKGHFLQQIQAILNGGINVIGMNLEHKLVYNYNGLNLSSHFITITKKAINEIGYFDVQLSKNQEGIFEYLNRYLLKENTVNFNENKPFLTENTRDINLELSEEDKVRYKEQPVMLSKQLSDKLRNIQYLDYMPKPLYCSTKMGTGIPTENLDGYKIAEG